MKFSYLLMAFLLLVAPLYATHFIWQIFFESPNLTLDTKFKTNLKDKDKVSVNSYFEDTSLPHKLPIFRGLSVINRPYLIKNDNKYCQIFVTTQDITTKVIETSPVDIIAVKNIMAVACVDCAPDAKSFKQHIQNNKKNKQLEVVPAFELNTRIKSNFFTNVDWAQGSVAKVYDICVAALIEANNIGAVSLAFPDFTTYNSVWSTEEVAYYISKALIDTAPRITIFQIFLSTQNKVLVKEFFNQLKNQGAFETVHQFMPDSNDDEGYITIALPYDYLISDSTIDRSTEIEGFIISSNEQFKGKDMIRLLGNSCIWTKDLLVEWCNRDEFFIGQIQES
ncbi:MAG: hypothetical protein WA432_00010 [Candidatus Babeliaceae bacterium]